MKVGQMEEYREKSQGEHETQKGGAKRQKAMRQEVVKVGKLEGT